MSSKDVEAERNKLIGRLLRDGPTKREDVVRRAGLTVRQVTHLLACELFEPTIDGWVVSQEGRKYYYGSSTSIQTKVIGDLELEDDYGDERK